MCVITNLANKLNVISPHKLVMLFTGRIQSNVNQEQIKQISLRAKRRIIITSYAVDFSFIDVSRDVVRILHKARKKHKHKQPKNKTTSKKTNKQTNKTKQTQTKQTPPYFHSKRWHLYTVLSVLKTSLNCFALLLNLSLKQRLVSSTNWIVKEHISGYALCQPQHCCNLNAVLLQNDVIAFTPLRVKRD